MVSRDHPDYMKLWRARSQKSVMLSGAKCRAKKKGILFNLVREDIPDIPKLCPVLDIPLKIHFEFCGWHDDSPSLDRINNCRGYIKDNIRIISNRANRLKIDASLVELEKILEDARHLGS
jgi:hypothetical protein